MSGRLILWALACVPALQAQSGLSLKDAVERAAESHPLLQAGSRRVAASEGLRRQASFRPNPRLILQSEGVRPYPTTPAFSYSQDADTFAYLSQVLEAPGKRERRMDLAGAAVKRAALDRDLTEYQVISRVKLAYWNAAGAARIRDLLEENARTFGQIVEYHEIRVREGAMAEADLLRVRLEGERLAIGANTAVLEADRARIQLFREMGRAEFPEVRFTEPMEDDPGEILADTRLALERRPEVKLARQAIEQAQANEALQRVTAKPDVDLLLGYKRMSGYHSLLGGVQATLPFRDRNQGNIASAEAEIKVAEASLAATEALVAAEVAAARREYELRRKQVRTSLKPLREQAIEAARIALAAYREGGSDLLRLLDAERVRLDTEVLYYRTLAEYRAAAAALQAAMGER